MIGEQGVEALHHLHVGIQVDAALGVQGVETDEVGEPRPFLLGIRRPGIVSAERAVGFVPQLDRTVGHECPPASETFPDELALRFAPEPAVMDGARNHCEGRAWAESGFTCMSEVSTASKSPPVMSSRR